MTPGASPAAQGGPPTVDLWWLLTGTLPDGELAARADQVMDGAERTRCDRLLGASVKRQYRVSRLLLRHSLSRYADRSPQQWCFDREPLGRPVIRSAPAGLDFNLAHTEGMAVLVVSRGLRCGVDVESTEPRPALFPLRHKVLAAEELAGLDDVAGGAPAGTGGGATAPGERAADRLARVWVMKEAYTKALGSGWQYGFATFAVRPGDPPTLCDRAATGPWSLREVLVHHHRIGVAIPADPCVLNVIDASVLLRPT